MSFFDDSESAPAPAEDALLGVARSALGRRWLARPCDGEEQRAMMARGMPELLARVLAARGVTAAASDSHLEPRLRDLMPNPSCLTDMDEAVTCFLDAVENKRKIAILADYDVDGAASCALLQRYLRELGADKAEVRIPDRQNDGFGPSEDVFRELHAEGTEVVLLTDFGSIFVKELKVAADLGLKTLVFDHHACFADGNLPPAHALVNPCRSENSPEGKKLTCLSATGVVFFFLAACNRRLRDTGGKTEDALPDLFAFLDLVALATICDVMPLTPLNRALVRGGLWALRAGVGSQGLRMLARDAGVEGEVVARDFGFALGPRLNAAGRVGDGKLAARLLYTDDQEEATALAYRLGELNRVRQEIEADVSEQARRQVEARQGQRDAVLLAWDAEWHPGVVGIVAARLRERYHRAAMVAGRGVNGLLRGSCRSVPDFDMGALIHAAVDAGILDSGGGHPMAAGFSAAEEKMSELHAFALDWATRKGAGEARDYHLDGIMGLRAASLTNHDLLERAGPYGKGNEPPRFAFPSLRVARAGLVGRGGEHVSCILTSEDGGGLPAFAFHAADTALGEMLVNHRASSPPLHVAGVLEASRFRGVRRLRLRVEDVAEGTSYPAGTSRPTGV